METMNKNAITVQTRIKAPVEKVWSCWTEPTHIVNWCAASDDWHAPFAQNDLREGGKFVTTMAARDNSTSFDFSGHYTSVERHKAMAYTLDDGRKVSVSFATEGAETLVTETFEPEATFPLEMQESGWQAILDNFKKYVESLN